jgi:hypothetical protein
VKMVDLLVADVTKNEFAAINRIFWRALLFTFIVYSFGGFASFGAGGFAKRDDEHHVTERINAIELRMLEADLLSARRNQCLVANKQFYTELIIRLQFAYRKATGDLWQVPPCEDLT